MLQESFVDVRNLRHTLATRLLKQMRGREPKWRQFKIKFRYSTRSYDCKMDLNSVIFAPNHNLKSQSFQIHQKNFGVRCTLRNYLG